MSLIGQSAINLGMQAAGQAVGMGLNSLFHNQQMKHQKDFQDLQIEGQRELANYGQALGLDMWNKTNYEAQMEHIKNAGLNPGLMYGSAGQGGSTNTPSAGSVQGGQAPKSTETVGMGIQMASQIRLMESQAKNLDADTANKLKDAEKKETEIPNIETDTKKKGSEIENLEADKNRIQAETKGIEISNRISEVNARVTEANESNKLGILLEEYRKLKADRELTESEKLKVDAEIKNIAVNIALMKSNISKNQSEIEVNKARINEIVKGIEQKWRSLELAPELVAAYQLER